MRVYGQGFGVEGVSAFLSFSATLVCVFSLAASAAAVSYDARLWLRLAAAVAASLLAAAPAWYRADS